MLAFMKHYTKKTLLSLNLNLRKMKLYCIRYLTSRLAYKEAQNKYLFVQKDKR